MNEFGQIRLKLFRDSGTGTGGSNSFGWLQFWFWNHKLVLILEHNQPNFFAGVFTSVKGK